MDCQTKFPRARPRRHSYNSPEKLKNLENNFILDGVPLSKLSNDEIGRTQPSLNIGIPQYDAVSDPHGASYFKSINKSLPNVISCKNNNTGESSADKFIQNSAAIYYLRERKKIGAGYTRKLYGGHLTIPTFKAHHGYHGEQGYRRNTPHLRERKSVFDYEDPFETSQCHKRVQSAPANIRLMRQKSARVYTQLPKKRFQQDLATVSTT